jgi:hypothetical protein
MCSPHNNERTIGLFSESSNTEVVFRIVILYIIPTKNLHISLTASEV